MPDNKRILRLPQVIETCGLSRSSIYTKMKDGTFPQSIKLGKRAIGWREASIFEWIENAASKTSHNGENNEQA